MRKDKSNNNPKVERVIERRDLKCSICPPNRGCNDTRKSKYSPKKPKHKDHR